MGTKLRKIRFDGWQGSGQRDVMIARLSVWRDTKREVSFDVVIPSDSTTAADRARGSADARSRWLQAAILWAAEEFAAHRLSRHGTYAADLETAYEVDCIGQLFVNANELPEVGRQVGRPDLELGGVVHEFEWDDELEVRKLLEPLDGLSRRILLLRFGLDRGEPCTLEEVADEVGLTRQDVRVVEQEAFALLKQLESTDGAGNQPSTPGPN
jgi:hypothetical protein